MQMSTVNSSATNSAVTAPGSGLQTPFHSIDAPMGDEELVTWLKQFNIDQETIDKVQPLLRTPSLGSN